MKVRDKVIVVTGGGKGLGQQLVLALLQKGAAVAAVDLDANALAETTALAKEQATKLSTHTLNITELASVEALPAAVIKRHGAVDALINNAGIIQPFVRLQDLDYKAIRRVMDVNFYGTLYMTKSFLPYLLERPVGHIANISSMGGFLPVPGQTIYGASKAAVKLFTEGLNSELQNSNIGVTIVLPGAMQTNIAINSGVEVSEKMQEQGKDFKALSPQKAAAMIIDSIERNDFRLLVGPDARFLDKLYRFNPRRAASFIYRKMQALLE